ncbi:hypothetical protein WN55_01331 [Dufourea novaeangliae]|uniref:Uncharacterized protein n=1 Tax=Dufourea novaeangliae TaxID=178035 RepID=A0A154PEB7_DUFNO|nr:hypothetical protein WN55_01331 [Dufourea novaeangliae]
MEIEEKKGKLKKRNRSRALVLTKIVTFTGDAETLRNEVDPSFKSKLRATDCLRAAAARTSPS